LQGVLVVAPRKGHVSQESSSQFLPGAQAEAKYGKEMLEIIECFTNSRVDLPVRKLEDLSRARMKCARHLRKMDFKKEEYVNLWKLCNIYSATAVDVDDAMREIRNALRKRLKTKETSRDVSAFRRLIDEYRPTKKSVVTDHHQEIYDKPTSKEKQRWLELSMFGRKKEEKKDQSNDDYSRKSKTTPRLTHPDRNNTVNITVPPVDLQPKPILPPPPILNRENGSILNDIQAGPPPPVTLHTPAPPPYPPPTLNPIIKQNGIMNDSMSPKSERLDEKTSQPSNENKLTATEKSSLEQNMHDPTGSSSVFEVSEFLKQLTESQAMNSCSDKPVATQHEATAPKQISPGTMYKPIAPPRPNAQSAKTPTVAKKNRTNAGPTPDASELGSQSTTSTMQSHTRIEILPSYEESFDHAQRAGYECMTLDRRGIFAKRHSIKIDTNSIQDLGTQRFDGPYLLSVPGSDYSIVVNNL
uniref:FHA domain-containing protein n=1 Tax=Haemonchus placei TaxID=6290 RepID=A0A158QM58_HAEPC